MSIKYAYKPKTIGEAVELLDKHKGQGKLIAGGTDLVIEIKNGTVNFEALIDISDIKEMSFIKAEEDMIEIGGATTFTEIVKSDLFQDRLVGLREAAYSVGSPQIRNKGTIGGNICNGSPAADIVPPLLALDAVAKIKSKSGEREVLVEKLFLDKGQVDIKDNEILVSVKFKAPKKNEMLSFSKLGLRKALAISRICTSVFAEINEDETLKEIKIANGSLGRYGMREREVEEFFKGKKLTEEVIQEGIQHMQNQVAQRLAGRSTVGFKSVAVKGVLRDALNRVVNIYNPA
ncbi:purine hydroxylase gamma subunit apoprotein [Proteiniborus ethanoligenes]|uniref:Purine hydroxylase gamma subunit apoprotein n=1 Tax=Proteiniborus ethanoligenes TaxID=415015 RepID=A0A1H3NHQ3_9FIRM|nr:FAD binding domain-containing protein [Proteiniborus ethanoligenes]SDY88200.1 purine hydroxylase gamma subunit apoprotein [Proteiniborus ethanoligenes]